LNALRQKSCRILKKPLNEMKLIGSFEDGKLKSGSIVKVYHLF